MPLQDQPMRVLLMLLENHGRLVTREQLRERLWPHATTGDFDHGLNNAVNRLREVLCDSAEEPRFIETLPKRGYRFIATVEMPTPQVYPMPRTEAAPAPQLRAQRPGPTRPRPVVVALALVVVIALGGLLVQRWRTRQDPPAGNGPGAIHSIAVLPFENHSGDAAQEYLADGITDAVTTHLAQIRSLRVISRTSAMHYKGRNKPLPEIARELRVDAVLEGSVNRSGTRVRIRAQLIRSVDDTHLWAASFDRDVSDLMQLEAEMAQTVADRVHATLTAEERARLLGERRVDPEVYQLYLRGRSAQRERKPESLAKALALFQQAIDRDAQFAPAYSGIADTYMLMLAYGLKTQAEARPLAKAAAQKALALDPRLAEAHTTMGVILPGEWRFQEAETHFRRALELNPGYARGHHWYARFLSLLRRDQEAIAEVRRAIDLDPLDLRLQSNLAEIYMQAGRYQEAEREFLRLLEQDPNHPFANFGLGITYWYTGRMEQAIAQMQKARALGVNRPEHRQVLEAAYRKGGVQGYQRKRHELLLEQYRQNPAAGRLGAATAYAEMGETARAFAVLEEGYQRREASLMNLKVLEGFDHLRKDPRYLDLLRRVGLPE